jgi:hypothetical protein
MKQEAFPNQGATSPSSPTHSPYKSGTHSKLDWLQDAVFERMRGVETKIIFSKDPAAMGAPEKGLQPDLICFSHLRWDFVFQRPQHLLTRFGMMRRVFYVEEPERIEGEEAFNRISAREEGVLVVTPQIPATVADQDMEQLQRSLLDAMTSQWKIGDFVAWYYTPMALGFTSHTKPILTVFDCMDELSAFSGAPPAMLEMEAKLLERSDLVFTGGASLYESKKHRHHSVYAFPSSIDKEHFMHARDHDADPDDQRDIPSPRIGFHGVLDERLDLDLLEKVADLRPDWHWILVGPVCKIDPASLPKRRNIHYLGRKDYRDLPRYLGNWQAAMMPFAHNASTRFISPTKTPEYLAAGKAVVSTSIPDVENPYGKLGLVHIADAPEEFVRKCALALTQTEDAQWRSNVNTFLSGMSWDKTWSTMNELILSGCRTGKSAGRKGNV